MEIRIGAREKGTRAEIIRSLYERAEGEEHRGKPHLAIAAKAAARLIQEGRDHVWVGAIHYVVTGD